MRYAMAFVAGLVAGIIATEVMLGVNKKDDDDERRHVRTCVLSYESTIHHLREYIAFLEEKITKLEGKQ